MDGNNMIVYLAGKMTGESDLGREKFGKAAQLLKAVGYTVLNPAVLPVGMPKEKYMPICLAMIDQADIVYFMDDWQESEGATFENMYAMYQGKFRIYDSEKIMELKEGEKTE